MNLLFWNIQKKPLVAEIKSLCDFHDVDILILAENMMQDSDILPVLNENNNKVFIAPSNSSKISFYTRIHNFHSIDDNFWGSIQKIKHPLGIDILLVAVHLSSKLFNDSTAQALIATRVVTEINKRELEQKHTQTIVIGDFNMNPFETGLISADCFHGVMDKRIAAKISRTVHGEKRSFFYNPMWSRLGDDSEGQAGTYYYGSGINNYFWNTFDQVLLRPSLLPCFNKKNLKVIDEINGISLIESGKISNQFSDHLPLFIKLDISKLL